MFVVQISCLKNTVVVGVKIPSLMKFSFAWYILDLESIEVNHQFLVQVLT